MAVADQQDDDLRKLLRGLFEVCEDTESIEPKNDFERGRVFEAKRIRRGIGTWFQDEFCGRTHMGEPVVTRGVPTDSWSVCHCPCCREGIEAPHEYHLERRPMAKATRGVATRHPRCGYPYCACVGQCFAASQPGAATGVMGTSNDQQKGPK